MPSSLRSKIHSGSLKRSLVRTARITSDPLSELSGAVKAALGLVADLAGMSTSALLRTPRHDATPRADPCVEIVVPVFNEQAQLAESVRRLHRFLSDGFPLSWRIVIADNASTD